MIIFLRTLVFVPRQLFPLIAKLAFLVSITMISFLLSLSYTSATNIGLMAPLVPATTMGISILAKKESLTKTKLLGLVLGVCGSLAITPIFSTAPTIESREIVGLSLGFVYVVSYSIFLTMQGDAVSNEPALTVVVSTWTIVIPFLFVANSLASIMTNSMEPFIIKNDAWMALLYISIIGTGGPYVITAWTANHVDPSFIALAQAVQPLIVGGLAFLFLGEIITLQQIIAFIFIAASVMVATLAQVGPSQEQQLLADDSFPEIAGVVLEKLDELEQIEQTDLPVTIEMTEKEEDVRSTYIMDTENQPEVMSPTFEVNSFTRLDNVQMLDLDDELKMEEMSLDDLPLNE
eukprot:TRINITY_DN4108_c0_g1_i2.p1 TRINITY_DN4108_c0_g1~~TRINITY_DN4108_c0_g1_i2.p1  ORF type:complete len:348 (-),score=105.80 TRINITY_DN4108_c0_g1_i2:117-1160(-)